MSFSFRTFGRRFSAYPTRVAALETSSSLSSQKQVILLQALITLTAMLVFYPGLYATFMSREDFLPLHQAVSLLQTKYLVQTVFLKHPGDEDWDSSNLLHRSNQRDILW